MKIGQVLRQRRLGLFECGAQRWRGFTVIEVLIVMAVTGILFIGAVLLIAGRQRQTEFDQATRQIQSQIQQVMNEVAIGFYPNTNTFQCSAGASGPILIAGSGTEQGENSGCIFVGKAMQFKVAASNPEQFATYTIAGLQKNSSGTEVTSLAEARPKLVTPSTTEPAIPDASLTTPLQGGLTTLVNGMRYNNGAGWVNIGALAFVSSLAQYSGGEIVSGAQQVSVIGVNGTSLNTSKVAAADAINANLVTSPNPTATTEICFVSGGTDQSALISIGGGTRQQSVSLTIKSNKTCS